MMRCLRWLVVVALIVAACGLFKKEKKYFPIAVGNEWDYTTDVHETQFQNDTLIFDTTYTQDSKCEITGEAETTTGVKVFKVESTMDTFTFTTYMEERDNDIYMYDSLADENPVLFFRLSA